MDNEDSVLQQLQAYGLDVTFLQVGKIVRCRDAADRGKQNTGWYALHEVTRTDGAKVLIGAFGS